ncbi:MAG: GNAT family acetyltransferase [Inquilinaceae bacterium]
MEEVEIGPLRDTDRTAVIALWDRCGLLRPWNDPVADIARVRDLPNATILVARLGGAPVASVMVGHDGHRGWLYYVTADPDHGRRGFGRSLVTAAEHWVRAAGIPKIQLLVRGENTQAMGFYQALGYQAKPFIFMEKWLTEQEAS